MGMDPFGPWNLFREIRHTLQTGIEILDHISDLNAYNRIDPGLHESLGDRKIAC